jgi:putative endonuclease
MYYVYVLQSKKDKSLYIGYTNNVEERFNEHNKGLCVSTKNRRPFRIVAYEAYSAEVDARTRERRLKQFKNAYKELMKRIDNCIEQ